jgi:hypothetical protein
MKLQYQLVATQLSGKVVFYNLRGFTADESKAAKVISLDSIDLYAMWGKRDHPTWDFKIRVSEAA